ncbi:MAG: hypothetical protein EOO68_24085, partial [Moraxellaceae bacterium]
MPELVINRLDASQLDFKQRLDDLLAWESVSDTRVADVVNDILHQVKIRGDAAVLEYTNKFDRRSAKKMSELVITAEQLRSALTEISSEQRGALEVAANRIRSYHEHQLQSSWQYVEADGTVLGQQITAMERVGLYVPGRDILFVAREVDKGDSAVIQYFYKPGRAA